MTTRPAVEGAEGIETREKSLEAVLPELLALDPAELRKVDLDVRAATTTVLGCMSRILELREDMTSLSRTDIRVIDRLRDYTNALSQAHSDYITASMPDDGLLGLVEEGTKSRKELHDAAIALCKRGDLNSEALKEYRGIKGFRHVANDIMLLSNLLSRNESYLRADPRARREELDHISRVGYAILLRVGKREVNRRTVTETADRRKRAFTLFLRAYSAVRRAVVYLRWEDNDADEIAPSLYAGKMGKTKAKRDASLTESPAPEQPLDDTSLPPRVAAAEQPPPTAAPEPPVRIAEPGLPGPFLDPQAPASNVQKKLKVPVPGSNPFMDEGDVS